MSSVAVVIGALRVKSKLINSTLGKISADNIEEINFLCCELSRITHGVVCVINQFVGQL